MPWTITFLWEVLSHKCHFLSLQFCAMFGNIEFQVVDKFYPTKNVFFYPFNTPKFNAMVGKIEFQVVDKFYSINAIFLSLQHSATMVGKIQFQVVVDKFFPINAIFYPSNTINHGWQDTILSRCRQLLIGRQFQSELWSHCAIFEVPNDVNARELKEPRESQKTCRRNDT